MDYKASLKSGDEYVVSVAVERLSKVKFGFRQQVVRSSDQTLCINALVIGTALNERGRPYLSPEIEALFGE
jgi:acyl-CoA thioester hydrolase